MTRVTDQVKTNTQLFLDELWKQSNHGEDLVSINFGEFDDIVNDYKDIAIDKDYKYIVNEYLIYLQKIGCIACYECDFFSDHYRVAVKRKEVVQ